MISKRLKRRGCCCSFYRPRALGFEGVRHSTRESTSEREVVAEHKREPWHLCEVVVGERACNKQPKGAAKRALEREEKAHKWLPKTTDCYGQRSSIFTLRSRSRRKKEINSKWRTSYALLLLPPLFSYFPFVAPDTWRACGECTPKATTTTNSSSDRLQCKRQMFRPRKADVKVRKHVDVLRKRNIGKKWREMEQKKQAGRQGPEGMKRKMQGKRRLCPRISFVGSSCGNNNWF